MRAAPIFLSAVLLTACSQPAATPDEAFAQDFLKAAGVKSIPCPARYDARQAEEGRLYCAQGSPEDLPGAVLDAIATLDLGDSLGWRELGTAQDNLTLFAGLPGTTDSPFGIEAQIDRNDPRLLILGVYTIE